MKFLFENWRQYLKEHSLLYERINLLSSNKRYVNDALIEIGPKDSRRNFPLSEDELQKIKSVSDLEGTPEFLGSGSKGTAWQFNNKVLKITSDDKEAEATNLIVGEDNPNVYKVYFIAKRDIKDREESAKHMPYIIVYELLDYPNKGMVDVTELLFHRIRRNNIYYFWKESYIEDAKSSMLHLLRYTNDNPGSLGGIQKGKSIVPKLEEIAEQVGLNKEETEILVIFWTLLRGAYNDTLNSTLNVAEHVRNTLSSPKIDYLNQLALGLTWLKKNGIRFSDLKTSNIMEKNNEVAIIDIGYSSVSQKKQIPSIEDLLRERETLDPEIINMIENAVEMPIKNISIKEGGTVLVQLVEEHDTKTMKEINEHWQKSEKYEEIKNMGYKVVLISNDDNNNLGTSITRELL